jgi:hypothetical protein
MSRSQDENWWVEATFGILAVVLIGGAAIYALYWIAYWILFGVLWIIPYLVFCLIPFVVLSLGVGYLWALGSRPSLFFESESLDYRRLAVFIPILVFSVYCLVGVPTPHERVFEPQAEVAPRASAQGHRKISPPREATQAERIVLQWPWLYQAFNEVNEGWQDRIPFLKQGKPYRTVFLDRNVASVIIWLVLFIGAPAVFFFFSKNDVKAQNEKRTFDLRKLLERETSKWEKRCEEWGKVEKKLKEDLAQVCTVYEAQAKELKQYQVKEELAATGLKTQIEKEKDKPGVLDSDAL